MSASRPSANALLLQALLFDARGQETKAIPFYRQSITRGLSRKNLRHALIGLGSSLRNTGQTKAAIRTLQKARTLYPRDTAITLFLALAHHDAGQSALALRQLADTLLKESPQPQLDPYRQALRKKYHALRHA